jgi:hypothetical protein
MAGTRTGRSTKVSGRTSEPKATGRARGAQRKKSGGRPTTGASRSKRRNRLSGSVRTNSQRS